MKKQTYQTRSLVIQLVSLLIVFLFLLPVLVNAQATIDRYPKPALYSLSSDYTLTANGQSIDVVKSDDYDYAHFSMGAGSCTFQLTVLGLSSIEASSISPLKLNIAQQISGNRITFTIPNDEYLIVWVRNKRRLIIAADPLETSVPPSSGTGIFNITQSPYNADRTGATMMTSAIQNAVNAASAYGTANGTRGVVYVPAGVYLMGNLTLKSNVGLYLEKGSVLKFSNNPSDYRIDFHKNSQGMDGTWFVSTEFGSTNIWVYGRGTIDGNGKYMQDTMGFLNHILVPIGTSHFRFDGPILRNSACWGTVVARSHDLYFKNYKHFNSTSLGEDDCLDINESQNVVVQHAIGAAHDDPFSTKTWFGQELAMKWPGSPQINSNITFDDCLSWTGCVGFKVGQGMFERQENITFKNSVVYDCARGLAIEHKWGNNEAKNITFDNIDIEKVGNTCEGPEWLQIYIKDGSGTGGGPVNNVVLRNIRVRSTGARASELKGKSDNSAVRGVTFDNIFMGTSSTPASSLSQMNITDVNGFVYDVRIYPVQEAEKNPVVTFYSDCSLGGTAVGLAPGSYTLRDLQARGISDNSISSIAVSHGFNVSLYDGDNWSGSTYLLNWGNNTCLSDEGWDNRTTSIRVRTTGDINVAGTYYLQNRNSGLYMDVAGPSVADGASVIQWPFNGGTNQQFILTHLGNGMYKIIARHSNKSLDVKDASRSDGAFVHQWTYGGYPNQHYILESTGDGFHKIIPKHDGKVVEIGWMSRDAGAKVQQWTYHNSLSGHWRLIQVLGAGRVGSDENVNSIALEDEAEIKKSGRGVDFYPNPSENKLNLISDFDFSGADVEITDGMGESKIQTTLQDGSVDVSLLKPGIYSIKVVKNGKTTTSRFVKK